MLWVFALNPRREVDAVVVRCWPETEAPLTFMHLIPREKKWTSWVDGAAVGVSLAPVSQLLEAVEASEASRPNDEIITTEGKTTLCLPEHRPMAVAVRDRSGAVSNFLPLVVRVYQESTSREAP
jgi:hypothetical protein